jgi:hypothetical protein
MSYGYFEQMKDIVPYAMLSIVMAICVYPISMLRIPNSIIIIIQILVGVIVYVILSVIFRVESFRYILEIGKSYLKNRA